MTGKSAAKPTTGIELTTIGNTHLSIAQIRGLSCRFIGMIVSIVAVATVTVVDEVISAIWREAMTLCATPFPLRMACGGTVSCNAIVFYAAQFDGTRVPVQIVLIIAMAVLTFEILLLYVGSVRPCIRRAGVTIGAA